VLSVEGEDVRPEPYRQRRQTLEELGLDGLQWKVPETFEDGEALWAAVCEHELEGVVAKRLREPYRSGDRSWVKIKNRSYWRYELEREGAFRAPGSAETAR
jgi:bifunctional non-homologous end joining protein LigD